jgi:hypothetical protein
VVFDNPEMEITMPASRVALIGAAVLLAGTAAAIGAGGPSMAIKPGLWEMTTRVDTGGTSGIPPELYDQLPPAQRAQMEARMAAQQRPRTRRQCITQAEIDRGIQLEDATRGRCTSEVVSSSRTAMAVRMRCRDNQNTSAGTLHFSTTDGATVAGRFEMTVTSSRANVMTIKGTTRGRWLGADCGNVKPRSTR